MCSTPSSCATAPTSVVPKAFPTGGSLDVLGQGLFFFARILQLLRDSQFYHHPLSTKSTPLPTCFLSV